ncbi:hypothetical protein ACSSVZ_003746 [Amorphus sp. MBR-141]
MVRSRRMRSRASAPRGRPDRAARRRVLVGVMRRGLPGALPILGRVLLLARPPHPPLIPAKAGIQGSRPQPDFRHLTPSALRAPAPRGRPDRAARRRALVVGSRQASDVLAGVPPNSAHPRESGDPGPQAAAGFWSAHAECARAHRLREGALIGRRAVARWWRNADRASLLPACLLLRSSPRKRGSIGPARWLRRYERFLGSSPISAGPRPAEIPQSPTPTSAHSSEGWNPETAEAPDQ